MSVSDFTNEYESCYVYEEKLNECRCRVNDILAVEEHKSNSDFGSVSIRSSGGNTRKYKLPKIEFTKFGGEIKEWLAWWAQFEKIHDDEELANENKFYYLRQSTIEKSKAREVVDSFCMTGAKYPKVIDHLTNRFGNKDTLIEVYVRELLKLVLSNAINPTKKIVVALDITRDKFAAILFPLIESCLSEELLRAWERNRIIPTPANDGNDRLTNLMSFLRNEVESEERITLARAGFNEQSKKTKKDHTVQEMSKSCPLKSKLKCNECGGNHWKLMCQEKSEVNVSNVIESCNNQQGNCSNYK